MADTCTYSLPSKKMGDYMEILNSLFQKKKKAFFFFVFFVLFLLLAF